MASHFSQGGAERQIKGFSGSAFLSNRRIRPTVADLAVKALQGFARVSETHWHTNAVLVNSGLTEAGPVMEGFSKCLPLKI